MSKLNSFLLIFVSLLILFFAPLLFTSGRIAGNAGDVFLHYYPLKYLVGEHLISGRMPLWNPYIFAGQPLLANPQSAVFYPLSMLFCILPLPMAFNYFIVLHVFLGGFFFYLLLRSLRASHTASLLGCVVYSFSSFLIYKVPAGHPVELAGYAWLPLAALGLERLRRTKTWGWTLFLSLVLSFQFLSGHSQPLYATLVFIAFHFIAHRFSYWERLLQTGLFFLLFVSLQFVPTLELSRYIEKSIWPGLVENYSSAPKDFLTLFLPRYFGSAHDGSFFSPENVSYFYERFACYFGIVPLFLAAGGVFLLLRKKQFFYPALVLTGFALALGFHDPLYRALYDVVPGLSYLRVPARFYVLALGGMIAAACIAWQHYFGKAGRAVKIALLFLVAADLFWWGHRFISTVDMAPYRRQSPVTPYLDPLYRVVTDPETFPANKAMLYHHYNLNGYEAILLDSFTQYIGLQEKQALTPTGLARTDLTSALMRGFSVRYSVTKDDDPGRTPLYRVPGALSLVELDRALPRVFFASTVRILEVDGKEGYDQLLYLRSTAFSPEKELVVSQLPDGFPHITQGGRLLSFRPESARIEAEVSLPHPGTLVFGDVYYTGWYAWAGGREYRVHRGNKSLRTLFLPAGEYAADKRIFLVYRPASWQFGLAFTLLSLLAAGFILLRHGRPGAER